MAKIWKIKQITVSLMLLDSEVEAEIEKLCLEGWEPFAVCTNYVEGYVQLFFKQSEG